MTADPFAVKVLTTIGELEQAGPDWDRLPQACSEPLLSHRWFAAAAETLHADGELHVITVTRDSALMAIAPLARSRRAGIRRLEFIGSATLFEPCGLLAADPDARARLSTAMVDQGLPFVLQRVPVASGIASEMRGLARGRGHVRLAASAPVLRVELDGDRQSAVADRESQSATLRRKRAMLERIGPVRFEALRPAPSELPAALDEAIDVEADGWKGAAGSALRHKDGLRRFVAELARRFSQSGELRIFFLRAGDRAVAMSIQLERDRRLWEIKVGYRQSAARASPGRLLLSEVLRDARARGLTGYEFLGSGDDQQPHWANASQALQTVVYYPYSITGMLAFAFDVVAGLLRRLRRGAARSHRRIDG